VFRLRRTIFLFASFLGSLGLLGLWLAQVPFAPRLVHAEPDAPVDAVPVAHGQFGLRVLGGAAEREAERAPLLPNTESVLILGLDRRAGKSGPGRPDTLLLLVLAKDDSAVGVLSIPRDLYVFIPGHGPGRINEVLGVARKQGLDPLGFMKEVVRAVVGLPPSHVLAFDLDAFESAVDFAGGIELDVPCPIADNFIDPRVEGGRRPLDLEAGQQTLDGKTAAMYVRSRHGRSDFSRARRQQAVATALARQFLSPSGWSKLPGLFEHLSEWVESDMRRWDMLALARRLSKVEPGSIHGALIGYHETRGARTVDGKSVLFGEQEAIENRVRTLFEAPLPGTLPTNAPCPSKDVALRKRWEP
jgi:LCP family protein required for cell wall assembly